MDDAGIQLAARWWFRSRGTAPDQDYRWISADGVMTGAPPGIDEAARLAKPGSLTIVCWVCDGTMFLFADGLRSSDWPRDHQSRPIELSLAASATTSLAKRELAAGLAVLGRPATAHDLAPVVSFSTPVGGFSAHPDAWRQLVSSSAGVTASSADRGLRWVSSDHSGLTRAIEATRDLIAFRTDDDATDEDYLLVVSDLIVDEDVDELRPYRVVGKNVTSREGLWPYPKAQAVSTPHLIPGILLGLLLLVVLAVTLAFVL